MRNMSELSSKREKERKTWTEDIYYNSQDNKIIGEIETSIRCYLDFNYRETNAPESPDDKEIGDGAKKLLFFFLGEKEEDVQVEEADEVDLFKISLHLGLGDSIFITHRRKTDHYLGSKV